MITIKRSADKLTTYISVWMLVFSCGLLAYCASHEEVESSSKDCIELADSAERKKILENGIRGQVRFIDETEDLQTITQKLSTYRIPALSLAIIDQGEIEWTEVYHNSNFPDEVNLDCASVFQAASLSKPVTFMAAVRMQAAGEIDFDQNIEDYVTDYELPNGEQREENPVTFRNIFSHSSGIGPGGYEGYPKDRDLPTDLDILYGKPGVNSPAIAVVASPNSTLAYSGGAYTLAELALQDIYAEPFATIMRRWILDPIGMNISDFSQPLPNEKWDQAAKAYTQSGEVVPGGWHNYPEQAAAGLWSTPADLAKFLIEIYQAYHGNSELFSRSEIQAILKDERDGLAYGFIIERSDGGLSITHYGGNAGFRSGMTIDLENGTGLVYLINSDNGGALGSELFLSASQVYDWAHFKQVNVKRKEVNPEDLKGLAGKYRWNGQIDLDITWDESSQQISLHFPNGDEYELVTIEGDNLDLIHPNSGVEVSFLWEEDLQSFRLYGQTAEKM